MIRRITYNLKCIVPALLHTIKYLLFICTVVQILLLWLHAWFQIIFNTCSSVLVKERIACYIWWSRHICIWLLARVPRVQEIECKFHCNNLKCLMEGHPILEIFWVILNSVASSSYFIICRVWYMYIIVQQISIINGEIFSFGNAANEVINFSYTP